MSDSPAAIDDGGAHHLIEGVSLPAISLPSTRGDQVDLKVRSGCSIVYCYSWTGRPGVPDPPNWDDIPGAHGSTPQTETYRDLYERFAALDVEVFGLSLQNSDYQREMVARLRVPFLVLSDHDRHFSNALGLPAFETGGTAYLKRLTLVVQDGCILRIFYPVHLPHENACDVLNWLRARQ